MFYSSGNQRRSAGIAAVKTQARFLSLMVDPNRPPPNKQDMLTQCLCRAAPAL